VRTQAEKEKQAKTKALISYTQNREDYYGKVYPFRRRSQPKVQGQKQASQEEMYEKSYVRTEEKAKKEAKVSQRGTMFPIPIF